MHRFLAPEAVESILPVQQVEASQLVNDLLDDSLVCGSFCAQLNSAGDWDS